jgi:hypothetical protein
LKGNVKKNVLGGYLRLNARNKIKVVGERGGGGRRRCGEKNVLGGVFKVECV